MAKRKRNDDPFGFKLAMKGVYGVTALNIGSKVALRILD